MIDIRLPSITAGSEAGQLAQIRSYLHQFAEQLQWALTSMETSIDTKLQDTIASSTEAPEAKAATTFNSIKSLIIKSADIVEAYYEEINKRLEGEYVAQSAFGEYREETAQEITANSTGIEQLYTSVQSISGVVDELYNTSITTSAYLKSGLLYYAEDGSPVYGLEIGQTNKEGGQETFDKFARFSSDRLSFYDNNDIEVAYISDYKIYITNAQVTGTLTLGKYMVTTNSGLAFKWVGGEV